MRLKTFGKPSVGIVVEGWSDGVTGGGGVRVDLDPNALRTAVPPELTFVLAGGLTGAGVGDAVARFRPEVVDVSSGVEQSLGVKDHDLVEAFIRGARAAPHRDSPSPREAPRS